MGFDVISSHHHRQHGMATYVKQGIAAEVIGISNETEEVEWQTIKVDNLYLTNVYKPPSCAWSSPPLVQRPHTAVYCGDFNSYHTAWGYSTCNEDGLRLDEWATNLDLHLLYDPKQPSTFLSGRWSSHTNPDLAFVSKQAGDHTQTSRVILDPFPHSQHRPSLITTNLFLPCSSSLPLPRWNFRKANWDKFTDLARDTRGWYPTCCWVWCELSLQEFLPCRHLSSKEIHPTRMSQSVHSWLVRRNYSGIQ